MKDIDDIEILDIFEEKKELKNENNKSISANDMEIADNKKVESTNIKKVKKDKPLNNKWRNIQIVFCSISALFILGCCIFYGSRLVKYYKIYNPKAEDGTSVLLLSNKITSSPVVYEGDGLYISAGNYIYKGNVDNNYIKYNNMLWRILKVNSNGTIDIILDDYINVLNWNDKVISFDKSFLSEYLNSTFLNEIDKDFLVKTNYCSDEVNELSAITCDKMVNSNYVSLLDITNYLNSVVDSKTYLSNDSEIFWLNSHSSDKVWHTNGVNVSKSDADNYYEVRPVVTLKGSISYVSGEGTKENPYLTEKENKMKVGSVVKLDNDEWIVYETGDNIRLMSYNNISKQYRFSKSKLVYSLEDEDSLADYLNTTYLDSLSYKDKLVEVEWYVGNSDGVKNNKITSYVGIPNILDLKLNSDVSGYYLSTASSDTHMYVYDNELKTSKPSLFRNVRPCIAISKNVKIVSGTGTIDSPFEIEV